MNIEKKKILPFALTIFIILLDQITKYLITKNIPLYTKGPSYFGDFIQIWNVANPGVAFSFGDNLPLAIRKLCFVAVPLAVIILVICVYFRNKDFTNLQRWAICGVLGGGLGNIIDRIFRSEGVIDFISVKFYGLFGLARWPTFNVADSAVVVCGIILFISLFITIDREKKNKLHSKPAED